MEVFDNLLSSATSIFNFIKNIPVMLAECLVNFPPSVAELLLVVFVSIIAIRILELVF